MQTEMPIFDTPEDALRACVQALGGAKKVGAMLWPDKTVDNASKLLLDCMNPDRAEKLGYSQQLLIFREAKRIGFHAGFSWWAAQVEYDVKPVTPEEQTEHWAQVISQSTKTLAHALAAMERIQNSSTVKRVA